MSFKIALNAGHGLNTAGKRCLKSLDKNETREWTLNSRICNRIQEKLKDYDGYELLRLDDITGKTDIALKTRTNKANNFKADFYLSIHHNAGIKGGKGGGIETYIYTKASAKSYEWQDDLYKALIQHTNLKGNRSDGTRQENLHEVRESNMPAVLIECGYMDSATDVPIILTNDFADKVATACVEVLVEKGDLKKKPIAITNTIQTIENENKILEWQEAAIADGFKFPKYGADGKWGKECEVVAKKAICKKPRVGKSYKNKNLTRFIQKLLGFSSTDIDGLYGSKTEDAVKKLQEDFGFVGKDIDGIVGIKTLKKFLGV